MICIITVVPTEIITIILHYSENAVCARPAELVILRIHAGRIIHVARVSHASRIIHAARETHEKLIIRVAHVILANRIIHVALIIQANPAETAVLTGSLCRDF